MSSIKVRHIFFAAFTSIYLIIFLLVSVSAFCFCAFSSSPPWIRHYLAASLSCTFHSRDRQPGSREDLVKRSTKSFICDTWPAWVSVCVECVIAFLFFLPWQVEPIHCFIFFLLLTQNSHTRSVECQLTSNTNTNTNYTKASPQYTARRWSFIASK